ncbi:outer membrane lipoprotein-sorting protein [Opitutaceae bacterium]|nr:outer membrane lipoprotein-sorting protein [Opitutaceae bacterium]
MKISLKSLLLVGLIPVLLPAADWPTDPVAKGQAIAEAADKRDEGWGDWSALARMELINAQGQTSSREMRFQALEQAEDGDKRLIVFDEPRDVKGTAFLAFTKAVGNDDQWLYLPALKRVKRISSSNKSGPFVGSEFAYEDLSSQEVAKYTYHYLRDEEVDGMISYVIERVPVDKNSGYAKQVAWIDQAEYRSLRTDYYDRKGTLLKTFTAHDYVSYGEGFWRAARFVMTNHQTKKSTNLIWRDYVFTAGLSDRQFSQSALKNSR